MPTNIEQAGSSTGQFFAKFLQLPAELRCLVYQHYYGRWSVSVFYDAVAEGFRITGLPDKALGLVSRSVKAESQPILDKSFSGQLQLRDVRVHRKGKFGFQSSLEVVDTMGIDQLLARVRTVVLENGTTGMLVLLPWYKFTQLASVELAECLRTTPFAAGKISPHWPFRLESEADGEDRIQGVFGYDQWTCVPPCVAQGHVKVLSVKRGYAAGVCLKAMVEHKADRGQFVKRVCEDDHDTWKWMVSCGGF